jgi:Coenzyme PQQ synthesis protein D (PqqD)
MGQLFSATPGLEAAPLEDGAILYYPKTGKFLMLNRTAAFIWNALSVPKKPEELVNGLCQAFPDVTPAAAQSDVNSLLEQLKALELVSTASE